MIYGPPPAKTGSISCDVAPEEPKGFSNFSPCSSLAAAVRLQLGERQGLRAFRFSLILLQFSLAGQTRASSTLPEAVSHGLCPDSLHLVDGRARSTRPKSDIFHTAGVYS
jgi:hypothetical protein